MSIGDREGTRKLLLQEHVQPKHIAKTQKQPAFQLDALLARHGFAAYLPITVVIILMFCGASWQIFWSTTDPARYQCYALTFWFGSQATQLLPYAQCSFLPAGTQPPFSILPLEYPPLTLLPFSLALLAPLHYYQLLFALLMSLTALLIYWLLLHYGPRGAAFVFTCYLFIGAIATAQGRYDLIPAALTLLCVIAADRKHWTAAYIALAFGVLMKIYPLLLLPALFIAEQRARGKFYTPPSVLSAQSIPQHLLFTLQGAKRWHWKNFLLFLGIVVAVTGGFALLNFKDAVISPLQYFAQRPIQIEATGSFFLWVASSLGIPLKITNTYASVNTESSLGSLVSLMCTLGFVLGFLYTHWLQWRGKLDVTQTIIALLFVFIASGKVFSPQYLIWLIPLLAYAGAFDAFWLLFWGAISFLTSYIYIFYYSQLQTTIPQSILYTPGFFESVTLRNALFVLVTLAYLFNWFQARQRKEFSLAQAETEAAPA